jgi:hypothetical protein
MRTGSEFSPAEEGVRQAMAAGALADLRDGDQRAMRGVTSRNHRDRAADVRFVMFWRIGCDVTITSR